MFSIIDMFKIGVGPSSSHTVGPMIAANHFVTYLKEHGLMARVKRIHVTLYGSLALTGKGHGTDRATVAGLEGSLPATVDTDHVLTIREACQRTMSLQLAGDHTIPFDFDADVTFDMWHRFAAHPNGMRFQVYDDAGQLINEQVWYSIGGGFVREGTPQDLVISMHDPVPEGAALSDAAAEDAMSFGERAPHQFTSSEELLAICKREGKSIATIVWENETAYRPPESIRADLLFAWHTMQECVENGCTSKQTILPGGLNVPRRAPAIYQRLASNGDVLHRQRPMHGESASALENNDCAWVNLFALAVNEENAGGGRIVTAPTNGSAGIIPAVLEYYWNFVEGADEDGVLRFLLTAGAIGYLFKRNASISGAEVGCQGEVGSACSMAAAGLCEVIGGTPEQVENAAEIGIEHNLGLTCDPVAGLVQIPCIERNAMASNTAINAVRIARLGDGSHIVSLDQAIKTMKDTGADMMSKYKETSKGGLAVNVVEC